MIFILFGLLLLLGLPTLGNDSYSYPPTSCFARAFFSLSPCLIAAKQGLFRRIMCGRIIYIQPLQIIQPFIILQKIFSCGFAAQKKAAMQWP